MFKFLKKQRKTPKNSSILTPAVNPQPQTVYAAPTPVPPTPETLAVYNDLTAISQEIAHYRQERI